MKALFTCGMGDFIAIETWITPSEKNSIDTIYWATRARSLIQQSIDLRKIFPKLSRQVVLHDEWCSSEEWTGDLSGDKIFCLERMEELPMIGVDVDLTDVEDYSSIKLLGKKAPKNYESTYAKTKLADISRFDLPQVYVCIHPFSENAFAWHRDFNGNDWADIYNFLHVNNIVGVILGTGESKVPPIAKDPLLINLLDKTTIAEALEITKKSTFFFGSASVFSVMAAKTLRERNIIIKGHESLRTSKYLDRGVPKRYDRPLGMFYYEPLSKSMQYVVEDFRRLR